MMSTSHSDEFADYADYAGGADSDFSISSSDYDSSGDDYAGGAGDLSSGSPPAGSPPADSPAPSEYKPSTSSPDFSELLGAAPRRPAIVPVTNSIFDYDIVQDLLIAVGDSLIQLHGINWHHIKSADAFCRDGIPQIIMGFTLGATINEPRVTAGSDTPADKRVKYIEVKIVPTNIELCKPRRRIHIETADEDPLMPAEALRNEHYYSGPLYMDATITATAHMANNATIVREDKIERFKLCRVPIIKGSIMCNTRGMSREQLLAHGEDPDDVGGNFIVRNEMAAEMTENITFNSPKYYRNVGYRGNRVRCEIISRPGDAYSNSDQLLLKYLVDDTLSILIMRNQLSQVAIPFFLVFRAFGWSTDREIADWIVMDPENNAKIATLLTESFRAKYRKGPAYKTSCTQEEALEHIVGLLPADKVKEFNLAEHPDRMANAISMVRHVFDIHCLPHIGKSANARHEKLQYIAMLIRNMYLVEIGQIKETDRDSFRNKRVFAAGENYAKSLKTFFNQSIAIQLRNNAHTTFNRDPFESVNLPNLVKTAISADEFEKAIVQAIISGKKSTIRVKRGIKNHLSTQIVNRKNQLGQFAVMRQISVPSADNARQSERAIVMRAIHPTQVGYVDIVHSPPEGEKVGISKQLALFAFIAPPASSEMLRNYVAEDVDVISPHNLAPLAIYRKQLARVFVNGYLVGYVTDSLDFAFKYRQLRREQKIDPYTTVFWDNVQDEVQLLVDVGRLSRPLMIVYNNRRPHDAPMIAQLKARKARGDAGAAGTRATTYSARTAAESKHDGNVGDDDDEKHDVPHVGPQSSSSAFTDTWVAELDARRHGARQDGQAGRGGATLPIATVDKNEPFMQGLAITQQDIDALHDGLTDIDDLVLQQKVEYITPEEQENCLICAEFDKLRRYNDDELIQYTHCDIPQAVLGITSITAPYGHHNQAPRVIYQTAQAKQTCGVYALNWPYRMDKEAFLQYICETPLVRTYGNKMLRPNGVNIMVAIATYTGYNQEDSLIVNKAAIERGLFNGCKFTYIGTEFDQKEVMGNPIVSQTDGLKAANYEKLGQYGVVTPGTIVHAGDVLIGKYMESSGERGAKKYIDRSILYKKSEAAVVQKVVVGNTEDGTKLCKVALRLIRPVKVGDKFSSRSGQKGICAHLIREADMMFTEDGERPAAIFNPHGIPSRMTVAQLIESMIGNVCADKGAHTDGTMFMKVDVNSISDELQARGFQKHGYRRMMSGITGEYIDCLIFYGPVFYQRLMKFIDDQEYSVRNALTDAVTFQPLGGQGSNGGLRIGEMEQNCIIAHGSINSLQDKFRPHSDGFTQHTCRCGTSAIINVANKLYKCTRCKDMADISRRESTWTAKMFKQECESMGIGMRMIPEPYTRTIMDTADGRLSTIVEDLDDEYRALREQIRDQLGDGKVVLEATEWNIGGEVRGGAKRAPRSRRRGDISRVVDAWNGA